MSEHVLDLPFRLRDRDGTVHVDIRANDDPEEVGHPLVAVGYDAQKFRNFPVMTATVDYDGIGFRAWMGWLQVIERHDDDGEVAQDVDIPPFLEGSPLYTLGYLPTLADCPANPDHPDGDWVAHAFLVVIPDVVRSRRLWPVAGFRWGYRLVAGRPVERFAPTELARTAWDSHRPLLEAEYPGWTFLPAHSPL
jgi:hypothetical protein